MNYELTDTSSPTSTSETLGDLATAIHGLPLPLDLDQAIVLEIRLQILARAAERVRRLADSD